MKNEKLIIKRNWDREGALDMINACTIEHYRELIDQKNNMVNGEKEGIFFAFDNDQFDAGYNRVKHLLEEGEKVIKCRYGLFGVKRCLDAWFKRMAEIDKKIADECDPQEVYCYEYNNYECMFDGYEGDRNAFELVRDLFGAEIAGTIRRFDVVENIY